MTAALARGEWSAARSSRTLPPGKTRYPFYRRLGGPQRRSGRAENLVPTGIRSRTVQSIVSRYTEWATGPTWTPVPNINEPDSALQWYRCWRQLCTCIHLCLDSNLHKFCEKNGVQVLCFFNVVSEPLDSSHSPMLAPAREDVRL